MSQICCPRPVWTLHGCTRGFPNGRRSTTAVIKLWSDEEVILVILITHSGYLLCTWSDDTVLCLDR